TGAYECFSHVGTHRVKVTWTNGRKVTPRQNRLDKIKPVDTSDFLDDVFWNMDVTAPIRWRERKVVACRIYSKLNAAHGVLDFIRGELTAEYVIDFLRRDMDSRSVQLARVALGNVADALG